MDEFIELMKRNIDLLSPDHIVYLFVPEILDRRNDALKHDNYAKAFQYTEVLKYISTKVDIGSYDVDNFDYIQNVEAIVPTPHQIINQKPIKNIPNN